MSLINTDKSIYHFNTSTPNIKDIVGKPNSFLKAKFLAAVRTRSLMGYRTSLQIVRSYIVAMVIVLL